MSQINDRIQPHHDNGQSAQDAIALLTAGLTVRDDRALLRTTMLGIVLNGGEGRLLAAVEAVASLGAAFIETAAEAVYDSPEGLLQDFALLHHERFST